MPEKKDWHSLVEKITELYAKKHGYLYTINRFYNNKNSFNRVNVIIDAINDNKDYDYLLFLTEEAIPYTHELSIEDELLPIMDNKLILFTSDCGSEKVKWGVNRVNLDHILLKANSNHTLQILNEWKSYDNHFKVDYTNENYSNSDRSYNAQSAMWNEVYNKYKDDIEKCDDYYRFGGSYSYFIRHFYSKIDAEKSKKLKDVYDIIVKRTK